MKNAIFTLAVLMTVLLTGLPAQAQVSFGNATKFNEDWLFRLTDDSTIVNPAFNRPIMWKPEFAPFAVIEGGIYNG